MVSGRILVFVWFSWPLSKFIEHFRLEQLVMAVNDLMESRIDANLKIVP